MSRNYSPKTFLRKTPNALLTEYFTTKDVFIKPARGVWEISDKGTSHLEQNGSIEGPRRLTSRP